MEQLKRILIIDDDREICDLLATFLKQHHFAVESFNDGESVMQQFDRLAEFDLIIIDIMLPGIDGIELCRSIRTKYKVPIMMLTAVSEVMDKVVCLELGADDYLPKPFNARELLARVRAILRRATCEDDTETAREKEVVSANQAPIYKFIGWNLDTGTRRLLNPEKVEIALSSGCYEILIVFLEHPKRILSRDQLLNYTKNRNAEPFDRSIDVQVYRLRQKLNDDPKNPQIIKTVRNGGYVFTPAVTQVI